MTSPCGQNEKLRVQRQRPDLRALIRVCDDMQAASRRCCGAPAPQRSPCRLPPGSLRCPGGDHALALISAAQTYVDPITCDASRSGVAEIAERRARAAPLSPGDHEWPFPHQSGTPRPIMLALSEAVASGTLHA
jgi:hypothetical protein